MFILLFSLFCFLGIGSCNNPYNAQVQALEELRLEIILDDLNDGISMKDYVGNGCLQTRTIETDSSFFRASQPWYDNSWKRYQNGTELVKTLCGYDVYDAFEEDHDYSKIDWNKGKVTYDKVKKFNVEVQNVIDRRTD